MTIAESVEAGKEETELEALVEVLGDNVAQRCVDKHCLPELIAAEQHGFWSM